MTDYLRNIFFNKSSSEHQNAAVVAHEHSHELQERLVEIIPFDPEQKNSWQAQSHFLNEWDSGKISIMQNGTIKIQDGFKRSKYIALQNSESWFKQKRTEIWSEEDLRVATEIINAESLRIELTQNVEKLSQDLHELDTVNPQSDEEKQELRAQAFRMAGALHKLEERRQFLLFQSQLTVLESEELFVLNQLADEIFGLQAEIEDFLNDYEISKKTILEYRDLAAQIELQSQYQLQNLEIVESLFDGHDFRVPSSKEIRALSTIKFSDEDIKDCRLKHAAVILLYAKPTQKQTLILQEKIKNYYQNLLTDIDSKVYVSQGVLRMIEVKDKGTRSVPKEGLANKEKDKKWLGLDGIFFYKLLSQRALSEDVLETQIQILEKYFLNRTDESYVKHSIAFYYDLLANEGLSFEQKQRVAHVLVQIGSGLDCQYLLKFYNRFLLEDDKQTAQNKAENNIYTANLTMPSFYEANLQDLPQEIHFVTHPLYGLFGHFSRDPNKYSLWQSANQNGLDFFEAAMIDNMNQAFGSQNLDSGEVPYGYLRVLESLQELDYYRELSNKPGVAVVFVLPKTYGTLLSASDDVDLHGYLALVDFLNQFEGENFYYIESYRSDFGYLKEFDQNFLDFALTDRGDIYISGGYVKDCLMDSAKSFVLMSGNNARRFIELSNPSTRYLFGANTFSRVKVESQLQGYKVLRFDQTFSTANSLFDETGYQVTNPIDQINTLEDLRRVIAHNQDFNAAYLAYTQLEYLAVFGHKPFNGVRAIAWD